MKKTILRSFLIPILFIFVWRCASTYVDNGQLPKIEGDGWVDPDTYQLWVRNKWKKDDYYLVGLEPINRDKKPLTMKQLRNIIKSEVIKNAYPNFKARIYQILEDEYKIYSKDPLLLKELVDGIIFSGNKVKFKIIKEEYQQNGEANLLVQYQTPNLQLLVKEKVSYAFFAASTD